MKLRSGLLVVILKEFRRFFTDRRMVLTTIFLPGIMIYAIYSVMGSAMSNMVTIDSDYQPKTYVVNLPASLAPLTTQAGLNLQTVEASRSDAVKQQIVDKDADLFVIFPADFDAQVQMELDNAAAPAAAASPPSAVSAAPSAAAPATAASPPSAVSPAPSTAAPATAAPAAPPQIEIFYNSTKTESVSQYGLMVGLLDSYKNLKAPLFTVNSGQSSYDLATEQDAAGFMFAALLPMLILIFLFSGCMAVAPESIAGEKERGTIATILVTPLARWQLALGKIISLSCIALLSGLSSFIGVMLSLPKLIGSAENSGVNLALYNLADYVMLLGVILSTVMVFVGLIALLSALARSVREAGTYVMPLMIVVMLVGVTGMFSESASESIALYLIPVYNSVQGMIGVFSFSASPLHVALTIGVNLLVSAACVFGLTRMFGNERVIFAR